MKRSEMLQTQLRGSLDTIQMCRDIVEGNHNAHDANEIDSIELLARIYTDLEILAMNQRPALGDMLIDCDPGDESDYVEPSSADR